MEPSKNEADSRDNARTAGQSSSPHKSGDLPVIDYARPEDSQKKESAGGGCVAGLAFLGAVGWGILSGATAYEKFHGRRFDGNAYTLSLYGFAAIILLVSVAPRLARTATFGSFILGLLLGCGIGLLVAGQCG